MNPLAVVNPDISPRDIPPRFSTLQEWLAWQDQLHFTAIDLGLDRCKMVAEKMALLPPGYFVVSIAGTNGKGSSAVMLEAILRSAGYKTGIYTSPHLLRYNERIRINGIEVSDAALCQAFNRIDQAREGISLTYFEFGTLAAMDLFRSSEIDIAIMEVGLGGRLDAVNMLDADVAMISTIDIDHEKWLGPDRETIAREKAGIFRSQRPAICADPNPPQSLIEAAYLTNAVLLRSGREYFHELSDGSWSWRYGLTCYEKLPVPGGYEYQIQNAAGVLMALQAITNSFPVGKEAIYKNLENFRIPGRFQLIPGDVPVILDVAHNRQSAAALAANLRSLQVTGKKLLILGMLADKDHAAFIDELMPYVDAWYITTLDHVRGSSSSDLAEKVCAAGKDSDIFLFDDLDHALDAARADSAPGDRIIITGSFITVSIALGLLGMKY